MNVTIALGLLFLAAVAWPLAALSRLLARRGIRITYMVPLMPKEEDRIAEGIQAVSLLTMLGVGVYFAFRVSVLAGAGAAVIAAVLAAAIVRHQWKRLQNPTEVQKSQEAG